MIISKFKFRICVVLVSLLLSFGLAACVTNHDERGEYPAGHVWATDMAAKDVVTGDFPLKGRVVLGFITRHADDLPMSADRALEISFEKNGFLAKTEAGADFRLDIRIIRLEKMDTPLGSDIPDSYVAQIQYLLLDLSTKEVVREVSVLSIYDLASFDDSVLVKCEVCTALEVATNATVDAGAAPEKIGEIVATEVPEDSANKQKLGITTTLRQSSNCRTDECFKREQQVRAGVGIAVMGILTAATGNNYFSAYNSYVLGVYDSPYAPHQRTRTYTGSIVIGTSESVRRGRPMQANIQAALEILSQEKL